MDFNTQSETNTFWARRISENHFPASPHSRSRIESHVDRDSQADQIIINRPLQV